MPVLKKNLRTGVQSVSHKKLSRKIKSFYRGDRYKKSSGGLTSAYSVVLSTPSFPKSSKGVVTPPAGTLGSWFKKKISATPRFTNNSKGSKFAAIRFIINSSDSAPFRSYWFNRFINIFVSKGKKSKALHYLFKVFGVLKALHGRTPSILVFEIMETYRLPFSVVISKRGGGYSRVHLLAW